jgi:AcrR family transcriptional regulator
MPNSIKAKRSYNSPRRREQAAATRREILKAAQRLLESQGYPGTTMAAIAAEAGVSPKTVYVAFETKSGLLRALWNFLLRGDEEGPPVAQRAWYREVLEEPDPARQLRLNARNSRAVKSRIGGLLEVIRSAGPTDPETAALWSRIQSEYYENQRAVVKALHEKKALRPEFDIKRGTDVLWTINHPDVWLLLVGQRGWSRERYEKWTGETACSQLLRGNARRQRRSA